MGCGCGNSKKSGGTGQKWNHLTAGGSVIKTYSSEMDARRAASSQPGTRAAPAKT